MNTKHIFSKHMAVALYFLSWLAVLSVVGCPCPRIRPCPGAVQGDTYYTGFSRVSLDPDESILSVALAGFAIPEGRFSLGWEHIGHAEWVTALGSLNGKLYATTSNNKLWERFPYHCDIPWTELGPAESVVGLTGLDDKLYCVTNIDKLQEREPIPGNILWTDKGHAEDVLGLASLNGLLYCATSNGILWKRDPGPYDIPWTNIGSATGIVGLTGGNNKLYAVTYNNIVWERNPVDYDIPWKQIGIASSVVGLTALDGRLYVATDNDKLWVSKHNTRGISVSAAAFMDSSENIIVMVSADVCGFELSVIDEVRDAISRKRNIPRESIMINATHTHYAPVTQKWQTWPSHYREPNAIYMDKIFKPALIVAIEEALDSMEPSLIYFGRSNANIGINRRHPDGPYDNTLDVIKITDCQHNTKGVLFFHGCHPVANEDLNTISPHYPGFARDCIESYIEKGMAIFFQGNGADINPQYKPEMAGCILADRVRHVLDSNMCPLKGSITYSFSTIELPIQPPKTEEEVIDFRNANLGVSETNVLWADIMLDHYQNGTMPQSLPTYVQIFRIGDTWKMVGISREVVTEYGLAIRALDSTGNVTVAGYCNDVTSYLPVDWHIAEKNYEGYGSFFWYAQPSPPVENVLDIFISEYSNL